MLNSVSLDGLSEDLRLAVLQIAQDIRKVGGRALLVGGVVRDLLQGSKKIKDVDIEVFGVDAETLQRVIGEHFAFDTCGVSFGVLKIKHLDIDVSLPRRESKHGEGHKGFLINSDPSLTIPEAASRRDFTINAMYFDPLTNTLEDPYNGLQDLQQGVLRHVSQKFVEDPLRVLRGMQFVARFNLNPAPETIELCRSIGLEGLAPERLYEEWTKLLTKGIKISKGLAFLRATGWVRFFPELQALIGCVQDPKWHPEGDVWRHTSYALDAFAHYRLGDVQEDVIVGLAVLCHDFGKPATTRWDKEKQHWRSLGHDAAGIKPTLSFLRRLTNEENILRSVPPLVECHMQPFSLWRSNAGNSAIRRLALKVGRIDRLLRVAQADEESKQWANINNQWAVLSGFETNAIESNREQSSNVDSYHSDCLQWLAKRAEELRLSAEAPKPIVMGRHLIALGYQPSVKFSEILGVAFEAQLDGVFSDVEGGIAYLRKIGLVV